MRLQFPILLIFIVLVKISFGQTGDVRGFVYDEGSGEPIIYGNVYLEGTTIGGSTDINGFFSINKVAVGNYTLVSTYIGYDTARLEITIEPNRILNEKLYLSEQARTLGVVEISAEKEEAKTEVKTSVIKITPKQIESIPSAGGEADVVQYLQIVPGVIFTGDQGGQLYIRGGSAIQTKVMLDGITVYNPFHSIGFFSVFETDLIRNVEVMTGGFDAEHGGRISAVIDIATKDGNKKRMAGKFSVSPFLSKLTLEGPLKKLDTEKGGTSISYLVTSKYSYLNESSKYIYDYIDEDGLPYSFRDIYGKVSLNTNNGSKLNFYGYNYKDDVKYAGVSDFGWNAYGLGGSFVIVPNQSKTIIDGSLSYSNYDLELIEGEAKSDERSSQIGGFETKWNFTYFLKNSQQIKYGLHLGGFGTNFKFFNLFNQKFEQTENTTEASAYFKYRSIFNDKLVFEPSIRFSFYPSLNAIKPEPRIGLKYNISDRIRLKAAAGIYTQNFVSTKSDKDVVNLFTGFISTPDEGLTKPNGDDAPNNIQQAAHLITGLEFDIAKNISFTVEGYYKKFNQLININRDKQFSKDKDFVLEEGNAYGVDFLAKYDYKRWFVWGVYSLSYTDRYDGKFPSPETAARYNPHYDRRHNMNFTAAYKLGKNMGWEASLRWNLGTGFPFTQTQGFYEQLTLNNGIFSDVLTQNGELAIVYNDELNTGRLPDYHRLDASLKKNFAIGKNAELEAIFSVTNVYNRDNIFYFDRVTTERVDQLPFLPSMGVSFSF